MNTTLCNIEEEMLSIFPVEKFTFDNRAKIIKTVLENFPDFNKDDVNIIYDKIYDEQDSSKQNIIERIKSIVLGKAKEDNNNTYVIKVKSLLNECEYVGKSDKYNIDKENYLKTIGRYFQDSNILFQAYDPIDDIKYKITSNSEYSNLEKCVAKAKKRTKLDIENRFVKYHLPQNYGLTASDIRVYLYLLNKSNGKTLRFRCGFEKIKTDLAFENIKTIQRSIKKLQDKNLLTANRTNNYYTFTINHDI